VDVAVDEDAAGELGVSDEETGWIVSGSGVLVGAVRERLCGLLTCHRSVIVRS
jgi:hypothetical protein